MNLTFHCSKTCMVNNADNEVNMHVNMSASVVPHGFEDHINENQKSKNNVKCELTQQQS